jgi:alkylation response protein AidB-like acyl-CoA dehydrogenase
MAADESGPSDDMRGRAREWLLTHSTAPDPAADVIATAKQFQAALYDAGFAGITWPIEVGGRGLRPADQQAFNDEAANFDLPTAPFIIGLGMCGPTIIDLGTHEQKQRYLRPLLRGEEIWCQLFSEPGAGSDVASLQARAVRDGDEWVLSGQKVWTTGAQVSDFGAVLARTDPDVPKHSGLTMFIVDMHAPGVDVRPLRVMTGNAPFNEVFFDEVHLPDDAVLGAVNGGWHAAVTMLGHERVSIGSLVTNRSNPLGFPALVATAQRRGRSDDPVVRDELMRLYVRERGLQLLNVRLKQESAVGRPVGARGSVAKLVASLNAKQAANIAGLVGGGSAVAWVPDDAAAADLAIGVLGAPAQGIAGGTDEVQRNIIGERVLGLPKEPQVDRDVAFRELKVGTQRAN